MIRSVDLVGAKVLAVEMIGLGVGGSLLAFTLTPSDLTAFVIAAGALITAVGAVIVNIIAARAAARKAEVQTTVLHDVSAKTEAIKASVDGASHVQKTEIDVLRAEMTMMRELLSDEKDRAAKLAQAAATALATPAAAQPASAVATASTAEGSLVAIDENTKAIEKNTATTKATVQDIKDKQE